MGALDIRLVDENYETAEEALAGLNGWHRWSNWAAHYFVDGEQECNTHHGNFKGSERCPKRPKPADISPTGIPYGKVCQRCLKLSKERQ